MKHPILRYYGGKARLAEWVISYFPNHETYVEPFGGSASVLLCKQRSEVEVYNDIDKQVVNVMRVIRDQSAELAEYMKNMLYSREEFYRIQDSPIPEERPVQWAAETIFKAHAGYGSSGLRKRNTGFRGAFTCGSKETVKSILSRWKNYPERITSYADRFRGVMIENLPALELIQKFDQKGVLLYLDPPYEFGTRTGKDHCYINEMTESDHQELFAALQGIKQAAVVLSGYAGGIYDKLGWRSFQKDTRTLYNQGRTEILWLNPIAEQKQQQPFLSF